MSAKAPGTRAAILLIVLANLACFWPVLGHGFLHWDDNLYVWNNPLVQSLNGESLARLFSEFHFGNWQPLALLSHALDVALFGLEPTAHHAVNLLLHCANAVLVYLLFLRLLRPPLARAPQADAALGALIAALLFALHPLRVESVAWIAERKGLLAALFSLLALHFYLDYVLAQAARRARAYGLSLGCFALALMAKPIVLPLPLVLLLLDTGPLDRGRGRFGRRLLEKGPFLLLALVFAGVTLAARQTWPGFADYDYAGVERLILACQALQTYALNLLWPLRLLPHYPLPDAPSLNGFQTLGAIGLALLTLLAIGQCLRGRTAPWATVWLMLLAMLFPVLGLVQVGGLLAADKFTYLASLPLFFLPGALIARRPRFLAYAATALVLLLGLLSYRQLPVWANDLSLWQQATRHRPDNPLAWSNLGSAWFERGQFDQAAEAYQRSLRLQVSPNTRLKLARAQMAQGQYPAAQRSLAPLLAADPQQPDFLALLAELHVRQGEYRLALAPLRTLIEREPERADHHWNLLVVYDRLGQRADLEAVRERARRHFPEDQRFYAEHKPGVRTDHPSRPASH